jgi:HEPN domain-containing protein
MSQQQSDFAEMPGKDQDDDLERLLLEGTTLVSPEQSLASPPSGPAVSRETEDEEDSAVPLDTDIQGALGLFAEASQDMSTTVLELNLGRHFACADYCNQVAEKAAQAVSLRRFGRRTAYNHDLRALGAAVGAPPDIQDEMALLTPFHPETFYADTPPEEADEVISAEQAHGYTQSARKVLRWARSIVLAP